jgi:hypothetical protein
MLKFAALVISSLIFFSGHAQTPKKKLQLKKKAQYEEVDFENMIRRYFMKESSHVVEGVYSVSCVITKTSKAFLSRREKTKIVEKKDNYARVAIVRDFPGTKRDFIEVSLSYRDAKKYPIMGEINSLSDAKGYIYHHLEPDGTTLSYSMIHESPELLEGQYAVIQRRKTITYKLSYLKVYPKSSEMTVSNMK